MSGIRIEALRRVSFTKGAPPVRRATPPSEPAIGGLNDPRCFMAGFRSVKAIEVRTGSEPKLIDEEKVKGALYKEYFPCRDIQTGEIYIISQELFDSHLTAIFEYEIGTEARKMMNEKAAARTKHHQELFEVAADLALKKKRDIKYIKHYALMIEEAAKAGGDYLTAAAIVIHNFTERECSNFLKIFSRSSPLQKTAQAVIEIRARFLKLEAVVYQPPEDRRRHFIQNSMNALICVAEGDGRALLIRLVHRLSSHRDGKGIEEKWRKSTAHIFGPQAERFGRFDLAEQLYDLSFNLSNPEEHRRMNEEILETLAFDSHEAGVAYLEKLCARVEQVAGQDGLTISDLPVQRSRIKKPYSAGTKAVYKSDIYPGIIFMEDLAGIRIITREPLHVSTKQGDLRKALNKAVEITSAALGESLCRIIYDDSTGRQTETKILEGKLFYHHVHAEVYTGPDKSNTRIIELQFMDEATYRDYSFVIRPHWAYRLMQITGQQFDFDELEECGRLMTGNLIDDVKTLHDFLASKWVYVYAFREPTSAGDDPKLLVIRLKKGALPVEAAIKLLNGDLDHYGGVEIAKIWDKGRKNKAAETRPLETGDLITLTHKIGARKPDFAALVFKALHPSSKYYLHLASDKENETINKLKGDGEKALRAALGKQPFNRGRLAHVAEKYELNAGQLLIMLGFKQANYIQPAEIAKEMAD